MTLPRYSIGMGDRFARQGQAQLRAVIRAKDKGVEVAPVWNKSNREHTIIGTKPADVRAEADAAVKALGWKGPYFVDADHIGPKTVDGFVAACDFFTLDVAEDIGRPAPAEALAAFAKRCAPYAGTLTVPGIERPLAVGPADIEAIGRKFLEAVRTAAAVYRRVEAAKGRGAFATEVSFDESDAPQSPVELFFILAALAAEGVPADTIAPRFSGRFNKGVDYVGDPAAFGREFAEDIAVIALAVREFQLPANLKLSVHSGSDKFSIYPVIRDTLARTGAGVHLKTAGTTWLEEVIGLAAAGGDALALAKDIYRGAHARRQELSQPYATVIDIDPGKLPDPAVVDRWDGAAFAAALRHDRSCPSYNPHLRQLVHVAFRVAAEMGGRYTAALERHAAIVAGGVTANLYERHLRRVIPGL